MPPLLIDVTRLLHRAREGRYPTGVDRVGFAYSQYFRNRARALVRYAGRWLILTASDSRRLFDSMLAVDPDFPRLAYWLRGKHFVMNWSPPPEGGVLFNLTHSGLEKTEYGERVRRHHLRPLYFVHDLIPIAFPEYSRPGEAERHRRRLRTMLETGCGLLVNSKATGRVMEEYAASLGVAVPPWIAVPLAPPDFPKPAAERPLSMPYFVVLGTIEPRKNHLLLLHVWRELVSTQGRVVPRLVVIGQRGWECEQVVDLLERCEALKGIVMEIADCDDTALAAWLAHAQALLFPSFAEGYGIPLVEALSLGTPVIASNLPVFRELAGEIPDYLDPLDGVAWRQAILDYARKDCSRRSAQKVRMIGWRAPTWNEHFEGVENFMEERGLV